MPKPSVLISEGAEGEMVTVGESCCFLKSEQLLIFSHLAEVEELLSILINL